ncbi:MAG: TetR/AcrR family transcriptional regulator [Myxococcota bacterium]|nr:TetR/AcrR family transcriptional regulator [Myxococcota bacterium]
MSSPKYRPGPVGGVRDRRRRENQQQLCAAALPLFLADGTGAVTIDEIVTAARMSKGSFYRYAQDKADLVEQIMTPVIGEVTGALDRCELSLRGARLDTLAATYVQLATDLSMIVARHTPQVLLYLQEVRAPAAPARRAIHALADQLTSRAIALTVTARDHGLLRDVDPEVSALAVVGAVDALLFAHLRRPRARSTAVPAVIAELVSIVLLGIRR